MGGRNKAGQNVFGPFYQCRTKLPLCNFVVHSRFGVILWHLKKYPIFFVGGKTPIFTSSGSLQQIGFLTGEEILSKSSNMSKKLIWESIQFLQQFLHCMHFWYLWKAFFSPNPIGSEIFFFTLYAMLFDRIYCGSLNIILMTGSQLRSHLTWNEMVEVFEIS